MNLVEFNLEEAKKDPTTYARIKQENGKTFLVDSEGNVLGQVVGLKPSAWKVTIPFSRRNIRNDICFYYKDGPFLQGHKDEGDPIDELFSAATVDVSAAIVNGRVLMESDSYCPKCGHNRDTSSVSSINMGNNVNQCQFCNADWLEIDAMEKP